MIRSKWALLAVLVATSLRAAAAEKSRIDELLDKYTFVGDFYKKEETREISKEIFWRYPYKLTPVEFPIHVKFDNPSLEIPATRGEGRPIDHLNRGRVLFLEGKFDQARATWLSGRARYGNKYSFHRRNDYFIGYSFLNSGAQLLQDKSLNYESPDVRKNMANASTFLSWAFIVKVDQPDPLLDSFAPKGLYNLAAIYWRYTRYDGAFGAATSGLNFLRETGRKEYRSDFHRILAEAYVKSHSYLEAVQELDTAIRQDRIPEQAAMAFARVGDIYFDLNNYELAEDAYAMAAQVDDHLQRFNPAQLVLRAESLFWLGRFSDAQKMLHFALNGGGYLGGDSAPLDPEYRAWASLRYADAYLALNNLEKAKLEYFKVIQEFRTKPAGRLAMVREACLELPFYEGNNVAHARALLEEAKVGEEMPPAMRELAWACQVGSFTQRERSADMLKRVADFAAMYPNSEFLKSFVLPVREYQATQIEKYFKSGDSYSAMSFFEKNRKRLFPKVSDSLAQRLFVAYADAHRSESAVEFWRAYSKVPESDMKQLRMAVVTAEMAAKSKDKIWRERDQKTQNSFLKRQWKLEPDTLTKAYLTRMQQQASGPGHWRWLLYLSRRFAASDKTYVCDMEYPLVSKLHAIGGEYAVAAQKDNDNLIATALPDLFQTDESCALSLLDLEASALKTIDPKVMASRYMQRQDWPLIGGYLHYYWTVSEYLHDVGDSEDARKLWQVIVDKGSPGSPEVGFAKARLDPTRTELENLWN
ncbi:MAG: hypothetical protein RL011_609 [Pseudomonadota bacterium]